MVTKKDQAEVASNKADVKVPAVVKAEVKIPVGYIIADGKLLDKAINSAEKSAYKWINQMEKIGVSALSHLKEHGNIHFVNAAYLAMPKGTKSASFAAWLLFYGAIKANEDKATREEKPFVYDKTKKTDPVAAYADEKGWWGFGVREQKPHEIFDLQAAVQKLIERAMKQSEMAHAELLPLLKGLVEVGKVHDAQAKVIKGEELTAGEQQALDASTKPASAIASIASPAGNGSAPVLPVTATAH